jgi:hypothetical protein
MIPLQPESRRQPRIDTAALSRHSVGEVLELEAGKSDKCCVKRSKCIVSEGKCVISALPHAFVSKRSRGAATSANFRVLG